MKDQRLWASVSVFNGINLSIHFTGRSAGDHTLQINMGHMKQQVVNLNDPRSDTNMTLTTGTGNTWIELYEVVSSGNIFYSASNYFVFCFPF